MRTTIRLDDQLFAELKKTAAHEGRTLAAVIEDALRGVTGEEERSAFSHAGAAPHFSGRRRPARGRSGRQRTPAGPDGGGHSQCVEGRCGLILPDVNVLVYAYREDTPRHAEFLAWMEGAINSPQPYAVSDVVLSSFLRIVTHPASSDHGVTWSPRSPSFGCSAVSRMRSSWRLVPGIGTCSSTYAGRLTRGAISSPMPTWPLLPSRPAATSSPPTAISPASPGCVGATR